MAGDERVMVPVSREHYEGLLDGSTVTGYSVEALLYEALDHYLECRVSVLMESQIKKTASA